MEKMGFKPGDKKNVDVLQALSGKNYTYINDPAICPTKNLESISSVKDIYGIFKIKESELKPKKKSEKGGSSAQANESHRSKVTLLSSQRNILKS